MTTTINRAAYENLVEGDLAWLLRQPRSPHRDHIERIVRDSPAMYYPPVAASELPLEPRRSEADGDCG